MNSLLLIMNYLIGKFTPVLKNTVFFDSFLGQYSDNPKYISQKLHEICPSLRLVWSTSDKSREVPPEYVYTVNYGSKDYYRFALNSEIVVDNHMGLRTLGFKKFKSRLIKWLLKKPGQLAIATWHGTPLKKIGKDQLRRTAKDYWTSIDYCIYGCDITRDAVGKAFFVENIMKPYGTPRNDKLVEKPETSEIRTLKSKLGLPLDKAILLFAPTFREDVELSGLKQLRNLDVDRLLFLLKQKFEKDFALVFRAHHSVIKKISTGEVAGTINYIDGNVGDDMTEYLECTDVLLTDYSSSMFDFALTDKPCFLYVPDLDHYRESERGLYLDFENLPFPYATTQESLYLTISDFDMATYLEKKEEFLTSINNIEDGNASYRIAKDIVTYLQGK